MCLLLKRPVAGWCEIEVWCDMLFVEMQKQMQKSFYKISSGLLCDELF
jgi:hypothetical protein